VQALRGAVAAYKAIGGGWDPAAYPTTKDEARVR